MAAMRVLAMIRKGSPSDWTPTRSQLRAAHDACELCECGHVRGSHWGGSAIEYCGRDGCDCARFKGTGKGVCECHREKSG